MPPAAAAGQVRGPTEAVRLIRVYHQPLSPTGPSLRRRFLGYQ